MKILYVTTAFPKPEDGATIYTDLAEELNINHEIEVVVADQTIPLCKVKTNLERGIAVHRIGVLPYYNVGFIKKGISSLTQSFWMKKAFNKILITNEIDLLLYESPPTTNVGLIYHLKRKFNCKTYLMLKDIFPQNAVDLDLFKKDSLVYRYFRGKEHKLYEVSDIIGCMSEANVKYVVNNNNIDKNKIRYFPNTKRFVSEINKNESAQEFFKLHDIPKNKKIILFGGNMGKPQNMPLLSKIVYEFKDNIDIHFLFIGRGQDKHYLIDTIENYNIKNVTVLDNLHRNTYETILPFVSIGLVILNNQFTIPNFPSRILSYMEYEIPVFAATDRITDIKKIIQDNNIGVWVDSGDITLVVNGLKEMIHSDNLKKMGENGRQYALENYHVRNSVIYIENQFKELKKNVQE